jgi:hypothetical protein
MRKFPFLLLFVNLLMCHGCTELDRSSSAGQIDSEASAIGQFRAKHPSDAKNYIYIHPTTTEIAENWLTIHEAIFLSELRRLKRRFPDNVDVDQYADSMITQTRTMELRTFDWIKEFKAASSNGGVLCDYEWTDGKTQEDGVLVIRSGDIVKREPWVTIYLDEQSHSN